MPNQSHSGLHGIPWHRCDRCGFEYPVDQLVVQRGLIVCVVKCLDKTDVWNRDLIIAMVLDTDVEEPAVAEILKKDKDSGDDNVGFSF